MTKEEEQENTLTKEIKSWSSFEYALREEDMLLLIKVLMNVKKNKNTVKHLTLNKI